MPKFESSRQLIAFDRLSQELAGGARIPGPEINRVGGAVLTFAIALLLILAACLAVVAYRLDAQLVVARMDLTPDGYRLRQYNQQVAALEDKMAGYIADSVETKLHTIEQRLSAGAVGADEIRQFEELKSEIKLLEHYTAGKNGNLTEASRLEHPRYHAVQGPQMSSMQPEALGELAQLKQLLYFGIASCGMMAMLVGGYWWHSELRFRRALAAPVPVLLLPDRARGPQS